MSFIISFQDKLFFQPSHTVFSTLFCFFNPVLAKSTRDLARSTRDLAKPTRDLAKAVLVWLKQLCLASTARAAHGRLVVKDTSSMYRSLGHPLGL